MVVCTLITMMHSSTPGRFRRVVWGCDIFEPTEWSHSRTLWKFIRFKILESRIQSVNGPHPIISRKTCFITRMLAFLKFFKWDYSRINWATCQTGISRYLRQFLRRSSFRSPFC
uniref:Uncharacterized protein n=1 Tax=Lactuca sativa TaxID=4236 RepID=A0A9R1ULA3_LACSA|nr:hypothetical protein LSAT_V11C800444740 [Lactuca sativa]